MNAASLSSTTIIGAGVIGLAIASRLARKGHSVTVLEQNSRAGQGISSRNSQVIHSGLYYPTNSLKARLCVEGHRLLLDWCRLHSIAHAIPGKLIVATSSDEAPELERLLAQGNANGVEGLALVDSRFIRACEPQVHAVAALHSPRTAILDVHALVESLLEDARSHGATMAFRHRVVGVERVGHGFRLAVLGPSGEDICFDSEILINAGGLVADDIAARAGIDVDAAGYRQHWVKGSYFRLAGGRFSHLVYPVPAQHLSGLGIHLTIGLDGEVLMGPDVEGLSSRREDYVVDEMRAAAFAQAASRYLPGVTADALRPHQAGLRPKLSGPGASWRDFVICEESARGLTGLINCLGMESPGLTSALAVAAHVERLVR